MRVEERKRGRGRGRTTFGRKAMSPQRKLLLLGTFVHSQTQQDLDFLHNAVIAVDAQGKIAAIERDARDASEAKLRLLSKLGWDEAEVDVTEAAQGQFFFPGFVGELQDTMMFIVTDSCS